MQRSSGEFEMLHESSSFFCPVYGALVIHGERETASGSALQEKSGLVQLVLRGEHLGTLSTERFSL